MECPAWTTASMPWFEKVRSTIALSVTEATTWVSAPGATSKPIATWPAARRRGARNRPSHPDEPVSRTRITILLIGLSETTEEVLSRASGYHHPPRPVTAVVAKAAGPIAALCSRPKIRPPRSQSARPMGAIKRHSAYHSLSTSLVWGSHRTEGTSRLRPVINRHSTHSSPWRRCRD